jgi:Kef-type K+ transport system membrane component KefB
VGITARVLGDLGALATPAARIVLGAAVIDDVLGLVLLAVVSGIIQATAAGTTMSAGDIGWVAGKAVLFLVGALVLGAVISPRVVRASLALRSPDIGITLALSFCFLLSALAMHAGLAPIVGAFAAGLVLEEPADERRREPPVHLRLKSLTALFVPVFFVRMGMMVQLGAFLQPATLLFALALTLAAVLGKLACGLPVPKGVPRLVVALGMLPRGEVGLIFAGIGGRLLLEGKPVVEASTYAAAVFMVVATTMATPPLLSWSIRRSKS